MRGIGYTLSRRCAVWGMVAGVVLSAPNAPAFADLPATPNQTAMAIPRLVAPGVVSDTFLPEPLTPSDVARVRRIFADQVHGRMADADREIASLANPLLMGAILADRYLGPFHRSTVPELESWLAKYPGQPEAAAIRALLIRRLPDGSPQPAPVNTPFLAPSASDGPSPEVSDGAPPGIARNPALDRAIAARVGNNEFVAALQLIGRTHTITPEYGALLRARVARGLFTAGWDAEAAQVAASAWREPQSTDRVGEAAFVAGLAEWRMGRIARARSFFADAAAAPVSTPGLQAAGAYWAARTALRERNLTSADSWLQRAATNGATFYGLIARRFLGWPIGLIPGPQTLSQADLEALAATPRGQRAFALLQVGQVSRAEQEFRFLWPELKDDPALSHALLLVAQREGLNSLAAEIADQIQQASGIPRQNFSFPVPPLRPDGGFRLNPALIYGMTRAESNFDPKAVSPAGALGLMQLMPQTARSVANNPTLSEKRLQDPGINLKLGQRWLESLADDDHVHDNLIALLASYNAGVGSFTSWGGQIDSMDPLLFIEAIPIPETRRFVHRALAYTWLYAARLGLPAPSLDDIVAGAFPRFRSRDHQSTVLVSWH